MTEADFTEADMASVALALLPPVVCNSLISDTDFKKRFQLKTTALVSFSSPSVSFQRSILFDAVRSLFAEPNNAQLVSSLDKAEWTLTLSGSGDRPSVILECKPERIELFEFWGLSPNPVERLQGLELFAEASNLTGSPLVRWREVISLRVITDEEFDDLHDRLKTTPQMMSVLIAREIQGGASTITTLVPEPDVYYDRLIGGISGSTDLTTYVETIAKPHIAQLIGWRNSDGLRLALLISAHSSISQTIDPEAVTNEELLQLLKWLEVMGDMYSKLGAIEFGFYHLDRFPNIEPYLTKLIEQILGDDPDDEVGRFCLTSALIVLTDGELARRQTLRTRPPFWRRLASIAQASLIERQLRTVSLDVAPFVDFAIRKGGHPFFMQTLIDLRREPRWMPDFVDPHQLKAEFLGRIAIAVTANGQKIKSAELKDLVLHDSPKGLKALLKFPYSFLPGPLEGAVGSTQEMPPEIRKGVETDLAADTLKPNSFAGLVNSALLYRIGPDVISLATQALQRVKYQLREEGSQDQTFALLSGLATVSGVTRSEELADEVRILLRVLKHRSNAAITIRNALRICMVAAAAHRGLDSWCEFVGNWVTELSFGTLERSEAGGLASDIEALCRIEPRLWRSCAKANAACKALVEA